jgi:hypothetical protein
MTASVEDRQARVGRVRNPYVAVALGVLAVCAFIVLASGIDLGHWDGVHADTAKVYEPEGVYGDDWDVAQFEPFSGGRLGGRELLLALVAYGGTFVIGERALRSLVGKWNWPAALRLGGGFLVGYVPVLTAVRLITLRFDADVAPALSLGLVAAGAGASLAYDARTQGGGVALARAAFAQVRRRPFWVVVALFAVAVVWTVQSGRNYLVTDSVILFLKVAAGEQGSMHWLPAFGRQGDEYFFNYPMVHGFGSPSTFALWFWLTNALAKASMVCLVAGFVWTLTKRAWLAVCLAVGLVVFATPTADPRFYVTLFGGENPAILLGHAGRLLGVVLPFLLAVVLANGTRRQGWVMCFVLGAGLMATSVSNILYAGIIAALLVSFVLARRMVGPRSERAKDRLRRRVDIIVVVALVMPLVAYATLGNANPGLGGIPLVVAALGAALAALGLALDSDDSNREPDDDFGRALFGALPSRLVPLGVGAVVGMLTMGNLFYKSLIEIDAYRSMMQSLFPAYDRDALFVLSFKSSAFTHVSDTACGGVPSAACGTGKGWLAYFGVTFAVAAVAWFVVRRSAAPAETRRRDAVLLLLQVMLLDIGLFLTDFMGAPDAGTYWIQTRFVEVGYYGILIMAPVIAWRHLRGSTRNAALAVLAAWFVIPFLTHPFVFQFWDNATYLGRVLT